MNHKITVSILLFSLFISAIVAATTVQVSGEVTYSASGPSGSWNGSNKSLNGNITLDPFSGKVCVDMNAWKSGNTRRDEHTLDMFEVKKYAQSCFTIKSVSGGDIRGTLEMHGKTNEVTFRGDLKISSSSITYSGKTTLGVDEFGMTRPSLMGMKVKNEVPVAVRLSGGL